MIQKANELATKTGGGLQSVVLLIVRLGWGYQLVVSGWSHLHNVSEMAHRFAGWHVPFPLPSVYVSAGTEFVGGLLLMAGLLSRLVSIPLLVNFCVAYATASRGKVLDLIHFRDPYDFINDDAFPFLVLSLLVLAFGPGKVALDSLVFKKSASG